MTERALTTKEIQCAAPLKPNVGRTSTASIDCSVSDENNRQTDCDWSPQTLQQAPHDVNKMHLYELLMLLLCSDSLLPLFLNVFLMLFLLLLLELPGVMQSSSCFTMTPHLLYFAKLPDALLMSCVQQLVKTPGRQCTLRI